jgi:hypothetical protein
MNVASLLDRFGGRYMAGAFWFSPILRIGPMPTRATPGLNAQSSMRSVAPQLAHEYQLPPRAVAAPRELSVSSKGVILPVVAAAIYGASAYQFSQAPEDARQ